MSKDAFVKLEFSGDWNGVSEFFTDFPGALRKSARKALLAEGEYLAGQMRKKFDALRPPNALITIAVKKSSKPLVDNADLRNAIAPIETDDPLQLLIGVPATGARSGAKLAAIHEEGVTVVMRMTDKQRRFLHWLYRSHGFPRRRESDQDGTPGIIVVYIPPRPFIRPTFEEEREGVQQRFEAALLKDLLAELL